MDGHARQRRAPMWERGWATPRELGELLGRSPFTVRRYLDTGQVRELPRTHEARGSDRRIPVAEVLRLCPDLAHAA